MGGPWRTLEDLERPSKVLQGPPSCHRTSPSCHRTLPSCHRTLPRYHGPRYQGYQGYTATPPAQGPGPPGQQWKGWWLSLGVEDTLGRLIGSWGRRMGFSLAVEGNPAVLIGSWGRMATRLAAGRRLPHHTFLRQASSQKEHQRYHTPDDPFGVGGFHIDGFSLRLVDRSCDNCIL